MARSVMMKLGGNRQGFDIGRSRASSRPHVRPGDVVAAAALAGAATVVAGGLALRRWERSELAGEELVHLPGAEELRIRSSDGAELAALVAGPTPSASATDKPFSPDSSRLRGAEHRTGSVASAMEETDRATLFVLAHGWTNDRCVWAPVARRLVESGHQVVCYNHRGHGDSTVGSAGLTLDALAEDMLAVLEHLDARDAVVAGHSMGGMTAQALATLHPERVRARMGAMVLVATACERVTSNRLADRLGPRVIAHPRLDRAMGSRSIGPFLVRRTLGRTASRAHLDSMCEMFVSTPPHVRAGFLETMVAMDLTEGLPKVDVPVTVVAGEKDRLLPRHHARRIAGLVPGSRLVEIPGAGHMLPIEAPARLAELLHEAAGLRRHWPRLEEAPTHAEVPDHDNARSMRTRTLRAGPRIPESLTTERSER